jgi:hypothetical protein
MDTVYKCGQMEQNIKVFGIMVKPLVKESLFMLMEMFIKVSGKTIKLQVTESTNITMVHAIKDTGLMIINTVKEWKHGLMVVRILETINKEKNMEKESILGKTVAFMMEIGCKIK